MAATVDICERNGAGATFTAKTAGTVRFKNANDSNIDTNNPMVIPSGATDDWSFEKWLCLRITGTRPSDNISNGRFYTDGAIGFGTGLTVWARSVAAFSVPAEVTTATGLTTAGAFTSGSPLALAGGPYSGTSSFVFSHVVLSLQVTNAATVGALTPETITFAYDEIAIALMAGGAGILAFLMGASNLIA